MRFSSVFLNLSVMSFPKFVNLTKNTPFFSPILHVFAPLNNVRVYIASVLKNNPNYVNFFTRMISNFKYKCPPPPRNNNCLTETWIPDTLYFFQLNKSSQLWAYRDSPCSRVKVFKILPPILKTIAVNKVTNRWRNHNNKTTKISDLNKIIELYEL